MHQTRPAPASQSTRVFKARRHAALWRGHSSATRPCQAEMARRLAKSSGTWRLYSMKSALPSTCEARPSADKIVLQAVLLAALAADAVAIKSAVVKRVLEKRDIDLCLWAWAFCLQISWPPNMRGMPNI